MSDAAPLILVVEDEAKISGLLTDYLESLGGYRTAVLARGDEVAAWCDLHRPDLVLLDLMLPGMDGIAVCRALRAAGDLPIIMVTARVEEIDRLLGLELGADAYICKPFSPREVVARVRAVLRRRGSGPRPAERGLAIDTERHEARLLGQPLHLTPVEFALLRTLSDQPGRVFSRDQLMDAMYDDYRVVSDRAVDTHVKNLRRKLAEAAPGTDLIESVYGVGYRIRG